MNNNTTNKLQENMNNNTTNKLQENMNNNTTDKLQENMNNNTTDKLQENMNQENMNQENNEQKPVIQQTFNFHAPIGQMIAHVDKLEAHFDKGKGMQVMNAESVKAEGKNAESVKAEGKNAESVKAEGKNAESVKAEGKNAESMDSQGSAAQSFTSQASLSQGSPSQDAVMSSASISPIPSTDEALADELISCFMGIKENALEFVRMARHLQPKQITSLVNDWVLQRKISTLSCHRDLWKPLHAHGIYPCSESNWNSQVK